MQIVAAPKVGNKNFHFRDKMQKVAKVAECFSCSFPEIVNIINFPGYIPNLTSAKDNLKIYN
jgi:hypothetical protein